MLTLQKKDWFLVSDVGGILRGLFTGVSLLTVVAILLVIGSYVVLWRTAFGLRLRSCGENPVAAESLGVNVYLMKYCRGDRVRAPSPGSAAPSSPSSPATATARARPAAGASSAWRP